MGTTSAIIRCRHCGTQIDCTIRRGHGTAPTSRGYVETRMAIRCPGCHKRLNATLEEFDRQIETCGLKELPAKKWMPMGQNTQKNFYL